MLGCCGNSCSECGAYLATLADDDTKRKAVADQWTVVYNKAYSPEEINCVGCTAEGVHVGFAENSCTMRKCCMEKGHATCAECGSYPCDQLREFFRNVPEAKANLESLRR